ncbi:2OG-Fe(II) oxygenase family protein [Legionella sp. W05-934-2]|uniref:2OG-Fe(II) oxygenase family protein n=1 Tax=Legionella sp. W05-934-2 TaxID=1198649 RepID=UPI003463430B
MNVLTVNCEDNQAPRYFCQSMRNTGFGVLENHPISLELVHDVYEEWRLFFADESRKQATLYHRETQDGFFPSSISEIAKGAEIKDIKEYYQYYPWGQYPSQISDKTKQLYQQLTQFASTILGWLEQYLPTDMAGQLSMPLSDMITDSQQTMLRILHYPPLSGNEPKGAVRAAAHEDINLITLLVGATQSGLQVKDIDGKWHNVPGSHRSIIVNVGDMLDLATQGYYRSTTHRVINPDKGENKSRLSMPLFLHPRPEVPLSPEKTAKQYLVERLTELGVL